MKVTKNQPIQINVLLVLAVLVGYLLWRRYDQAGTSNLAIPNQLRSGSIDPKTAAHKERPLKTSNATYGGIAWDKSFYRAGNLTGDEIFHHKAYYDVRDPAGPRIRLLVTARCEVLNGYIDISINRVKLGIEWKKCTNYVPCPNDEGCKYWHFDIASKVYKGPIPEKVTVHHHEKSREVPLFVAPSRYTDTVSACIGPLYWFNDWIRMIIFVEYWRYLGVSKFLFTPFVISKDVLRVIEFYKAQGIVETHGWPLLPFNDKVDPNYGVHVVSDNLDTQHCAFWSSSKYTYVGDIDELLYIRKRAKLFDFLETWNRRKKDLGGLTFPHVGLSFRPRLVPNPFNEADFLKLNALKHAMAFRDDREPKSIFVTRFIRIAWVHRPKEHLAGKKRYDVPQSEAMCMHARISFEDFRQAINDSKTQFPDVKLFADDEVDAQLNQIRTTINAIFDGRLPEYRTPSVYAAVQECKKASIPKRKECYEQGVSCFEAIHSLDDWIYSEPTDESNYIPI